MKTIAYTCLTLSLLAMLGCSTVTNRVDEFKNKVDEFQAPKVEDEALAGLESAIRKVADEAKGRVGVDVVLLETGDSVSLDGSGKYPMQSVYKLPISMAAFKHVEDGKLKLDQKIKVEKTEYVRKGMRSPLRDDNPNGAEVTVEELIRLSMAESDGSASDVLMRLVGGAAGVQSYLTSINVGEMIVANYEREIGADWETQYANWASPEGSTSLLRALHEKRGISEAHQKLLLKFMIESGPGAKRLKGDLPAGTIVAHKTGTGGTKDGITGATNDIGIITLPNGQHLAIAVYVSDSPGTEAVREKVIAGIAKIAWDNWAR